MFNRTNVFAGGAFLDYVEGVTLAQLVEAFGKPDDGCEPEKGYNWEYTFESAHEGYLVRLYDRWGRPRIGGGNRGDGRAFGAWLATVIPGAKLAESPVYVLPYGHGVVPNTER